jgi:beta-aspartyl-peptidase (threonine type)
MTTENGAARAWRLVVHGGAGRFERDAIGAEQEAGIRAGLSRALAEGGAVLAGGGAAIDAVEVAVRVLEDDPNFNAGRGAVLDYDGRVELDAAIMEGASRRAGAIAGVSRSRHPVSVARRVMEASPHAFLRGDGADQFSCEQGLEQVANDWFVTLERRRQLDELRARGDAGAFDADLKYGTVGAVAFDQAGHVAAATSTGGLTGKRWGRIGDSPVIGAGTYADDRAAAVSATGSGEQFLRVGAAHEICARIRLLGEAPQAAADAVMGEVGALGGAGGVIVVTLAGEAIFSFTTPGMYRGEASPAGHTTALYRDEVQGSGLRRLALP